MVTLVTILLLVGTVVVSGSILNTYPYPPPFEGYGLPGDKPIIAFGVPNFYPIEARKYCDDIDKFVSSEGKKLAPAQFVLEKAKIPEGSESPKPEPVIIPEAPVLPPFTLPELPFRFVVENPAPEIIAEPRLPTIIKEKQPLNSDAPVLPPLFLSEVPALVIKEGLKEEPFVIPEAPILPSLILPELPRRFNVEEPAPIFTNDIFESPEVPKIIKEISLADIPEAPVLPPLSLPKVRIPITTEEPTPAVIIKEAPLTQFIFEEAKILEEPKSPKLESLVIPEAPVLPLFTLPELPFRFVVEDPDSENIDEPKLPTIIEKKQPSIPEAPVLPPLFLSEVPAFGFKVGPKEEPIVIPEAPILPSLILPELPRRFNVEEPAPIFTNNGFKAPALPKIIKEISLADIPEAPVLPLLSLSKICIPITTKEVPAIIEKAPPAQFVFEEAKIPEGSESPKPESLVIPEAPVLPPFTLPELPFRFVVEDPAPKIIDEPKLPTIIEEKQLSIPEAPVLPPLFLSEVPDFGFKIGPKEEPIVIPEAPILPSLIVPELPRRFNVEEPAPIFTNDIFESPEVPKIIKEISLADIPEAPVLPPLSLPKVRLPITTKEPAPAVIIKEAPLTQFIFEEAKILEEPKSPKLESLVIPEAPVLPPFTLPELPFRFGVEDPDSENIDEPKLPTIIEKKQPSIPEAPVLPPLFLSEVPAFGFKVGPKEEPIVIPEAPILPSLILPELPRRYNVEEPAPIFTNDIFESPEVPKIIKEISLADIPEAPVLPPLSLPKVRIPITTEEPTPAVIIEEAPQLPKAIEEPVIIPAAPMLPPLSLPDLPVRVAVEEPIVISAAPKLPAPIEIIHSPGIPSVTPGCIQDIVPKTYLHPKLQGVESFINGRSPIIIKVPVQIVIDGGSDPARLASPDCIATIKRERLIPNLVGDCNKVIIPGPKSEIFAVPL